MLELYGPPLPAQILEEIIFWKKQEQEHTVVIKAIVPQLEEPYVKLLDEWAVVFESTGQAARQLLETSSGCSPAELAAAAAPLIQVACAQSREFIRQLYALMEGSAAVKAQPLAGTVLLHIIRESEYFVNTLGALTMPRDAPATLTPPDSESREPGPVPIGGHTLPPLPYAYNALEPYIDEKTMRIHHDKHHQSYVDGLNKAEKKLAEARKTRDFDLVKHWERELAFNGAGHYLHTIFWNVMSPQGGGRPTGALLDAIEHSFGSYEAFKEQFTEAANKVEGGGWAILVWSPRSHRLEILTAEKHQNLSQWDVVPLLTLDVWEHAYYLKHQNNRADYIKDWWKVVNWPYVSERFTAARKLVWQPY
ncbi:Fe-Mn family superoxide dismutase [Paenibacillus sp. P46E]|uniref:Fe-Mn family superoxide dismutase n=1 Tax=Paenibacillus sp. P46E TaxID=1349436 RepID=UPI00093E2BC5|nr:Fe-Mn family superoxide dismutase [Paenibacillus sp. P46E]OKP99898.1 superoxide dismutase [Paenibacillus sp. P46E]